MEELLRTDDPVKLSALLAALDEAGVEAVVFDDHTAGAFPGVMDAMRRRVMVADDDAPRARRVLESLP